MPAKGCPVPRTLEPVCIDTELIESRIKADDANREALSAPGSGWHTAVSLDVSYSRLKTMDNLQGLETLTTLKLDNNQLTQIKGMAHLVNLTWLDLSFNALTEVPIEELAPLVQLRDLSLFSNQIATLPPLALKPLTKLSVLSLGSNKITDLEVLLPLRDLPALMGLTMTGNAVCERSDYEAFVVAHLGKKEGENLRYLDHRIVSPETLAMALEQFQNEIETLEVSESVRADELSAASADAVAKQKLREVFLFEVMTIFDEMDKNDPDLPKLARMEGLAELQEGLRSSLLELGNTLKADVVVRCAEMDEHIADVTYNVDGAYAASQERSLGIIRSLKRKQKRMFRSMRLSEPPVVTHTAPPAEEGFEFRSALAALDAFEKEELLQAQEQLEQAELDIQGEVFEANDSFEDAFAAMMSATTEIVAEFFQKAMGCQNSFNESVRELAAAAVGQYAEDHADDDIDPEALAAGDDATLDEDNDAYELLLSNFDATMEVVNGSHEKHEATILGFDTASAKGIKRKKEATISGRKEREFMRSRNAIADILKLCGETRQEIVTAKDAIRAVWVAESQGDDEEHDM